MLLTLLSLEKVMDACADGQHWIQGALVVHVSQLLAVLHVLISLALPYFFNSVGLLRTNVFVALLPIQALNQLFARFKTALHSHRLW